MGIAKGENAPLQHLINKLLNGFLKSPFQNIPDHNLKVFLHTASKLHIGTYFDDLYPSDHFRCLEKKCQDHYVRYTVTSLDKLRIP